MGLTAILFPGQGSQTADMRELVAELRPDLLERVTAAVGEDPFPRVEQGTEFAQPAIFAASLAGWESLGRPDGDFMAGHSLGELGALVAAGALAEPDAIELVVLRGRLMSQAGAGGMLALLGSRAADRAGELAEAHGLSVANDNSPQQVVLSGARESLPGAAKHAEELGLRAKELPVTGAFHSPMMAAAVPEFAVALADVSFRAPRVPVLSAVTAATFEDPRRELAQALTMSVRWREVVLALHDRGVEEFVEVGPGRVLSGLVKRTLRATELAGA